MTHRVWTEVRHNMSDNDYECLKLPISVDDILDYQTHIGKKLQSYWGLRNKDYISDRDLVKFITWLDKNKINQERQVMNYNLSKPITFDDVIETKTIKKLTPQEEIEAWLNS